MLLRKIFVKDGLKLLQRVQRTSELPLELIKLFFVVYIENKAMQHINACCEIIHGDQNIGAFRLAFYSDLVWVDTAAASVVDIAAHIEDREPVIVVFELQCGHCFVLLQCVFYFG